MHTEDKSLLLQVLASVFEDFAFMFVEEEEPDSAQGAPEAAVEAEIGFTSRAASGQMAVAAPLSLCSELAENILGAEEELPEDAGENALSEFLNVACGYFLAEKFGTDVVFDLSIPATRSVAPDQWEAWAAGEDRAFFLVDESPMLARFVLDSQE